MDDPTSTGLLGGLADNPLLYLASGLLSQRGAGSSLGAGLLGGMQAYQQNRAANQQYQMQQLQLQRQQALWSLMDQAMRGPGGQASAAGVPAAPPTPSLSSFPSAPGGVPAPSPQAIPGPSQVAPSGPSPYAPMSMADIQGAPLPSGTDPRLAYALSWTAQDPTAQQQAIWKQQLETTKMLHRPALAELDSLLKGDHPAAYVQRHPALMDLWKTSAPGIQVDPNDPRALTDENVRTAFLAPRNILASSLEEPTIGAPEQWVSAQLPGGIPGQRNLASNKLEALPQPELKEVDLGDNSPTFLTPQEAHGKKAFSPFAAQNPQAADAQARLIASYRAPPIGGMQLRTPQGQAVLAKVMQINPAYDSAQYGARSNAVRSWYAGDNQKRVEAVGTAFGHLQQLKDYANALQSHDFTAANYISQTVGGWLGYAPPGELAGVRKLAMDEVGKVVLGGPGGVSDRETLEKLVPQFGSPSQTTGSVNTMQGLMSSRIERMRQSFKNGTKLGDQDFDAMFDAPTLQSMQAAHAYTKPEAANALPPRPPTTIPQGQPPATAQKPPIEGAAGMSKSGKPIVFRGGRWEYKQ